MTRDNMALGISENRIGKAERFDGCADLIDLALGMGARVARIGGPSNNRGSSEVFLTKIEADGSFKSVTSLAKARF